MYDELGKYHYVLPNQKAGYWTNSIVKMDTKKSVVIIAIKPSVQKEY